ncbi:MAG: hypothetical protein HY301_05480 [Verrucomicrobia bacterium]|nr:hypothetical protein [Verrucomicrobiota bacterium]
MTLRQLLIGVTIWLALLALGITWASGPFRWINALTSFPDEVRIEDVKKQFPIRFAPLPVSELKKRMSQIENDEQAAPPDFDAADWAMRESRYRGLLVFALWMFSGVVLHWFIGKVLRGEKDFSR